MALLRDARTSATILEGTVEEVALAAAELDEGAYLFDDVGLDFDADAVREGHASRVAGLEGALAEAKADKDTEAAKRLKDALEAARAPADAAPGLAEAAAKRAADAQAGLPG